MMTNEKEFNCSCPNCGSTACVKRGFDAKQRRLVKCTACLRCYTEELNRINSSELEEKEVLFVNKVEELKKIFEKQNLDKLQTLKFDIKDFNLKLEDEDQTGKPDGVVTE
jgi:putative hemolysin